MPNDGNQLPFLFQQGSHRPATTSWTGVAGRQKAQAAQKLPPMFSREGKCSFLDLATPERAGDANTLVTRPSRRPHTSKLALRCLRRCLARCCCNLIALPWARLKPGGCDTRNGLTEQLAGSCLIQAPFAADADYLRDSQKQL